MAVDNANKSYSLVSVLYRLLRGRQVTNVDLKSNKKTFCGNLLYCTKSAVYIVC